MSVLGCETEVRCLIKGVEVQGKLHFNEGCRDVFLMNNFIGNRTNGQKYGYTNSYFIGKSGALDFDRYTVTDMHTVHTNIIVNKHTRFKNGPVAVSTVQYEQFESNNDVIHLGYKQSGVVYTKDTIANMSVEYHEGRIATMVEELSEARLKLRRWKAFNKKGWK
tara:strand:- start:4518 stop:5009 length:492 start_codon:yes stop_codon:yes gene_type:complete